MITYFWLVNDYNARKCYVLVMDVMWMRLTEFSCVVMSCAGTIATAQFMVRQQTRT